MSQISDYERLVVLSGADPETRFWHSGNPDNSIPLFQEIQGDEPYKTSLRKAAYALYELFQQNSPVAAESPGLPRKPTGDFLTAVMLLLHSMSYIVSHPRIVRDGKVFDQQYVAIPLNKNDFRPGQKYQELAYGPFRKAVSALKHLAPEGGQPWIQHVPGFFDQQTKEGKRTRIAPSKDFCNWMVQQALIFSRRTISKNQSNRTEKHGVLQVSVLDPADPDKKTKLWLDRPLAGDELVLPVLNKRLARLTLACPLPDYGTYTAHYDFTQGHSKLFLGGKEYFRRVFTDKDGRGGRLYGRWVQNVPSTLRQYLTIEGEPTAELDFQNMQLVLLYAMSGKAVPDGDLYEIEGQNRDWMKAVLTASVGVATRDEALGALRRKLVEANLSRTGLAEALYDTFWDQHSRVYPHGEGAEALWGKLQYADSQIALRVLRYMLEQGVPALPIHDSFVVQEQHWEKLHMAMRTAWRDFWPHTRIRIK